MPRAPRGCTFVGMRFRAGSMPAGLHRLDPVQVDVLVGMVLLVAIEVQLRSGSSGHARLAAAAGGAMLAVAVMLRRATPFAALLVAVAAVLGQEALGGRLTQEAVGALPALMLVFYAAGAFLDERLALAGVGIGLAGVVSQVLIRTTAFADVFFAAVFLILLPWGVGRMLRTRGARERAHRAQVERLDAQREQLARSAAFAERARIARELHDVITHSVSVMVIQAGAARMVMASDPERAEASLESVARAGREALAEMRRLLGVLGGGGGPQGLAPQPGLADVEGLVARASAAGLATELRVIGEPSTVSPALDLCAYRIVQEALTNAIKHAGPARATVSVRWASDAIEVEVADTGRGRHANDRVPGGHGIPGMRERAALHGGHVHVGPATSGGFVVQARLPRHRAVA
jgi:signal transduction histidine kinase